MYKDTYNVKIVIEGRRIKQDYPELYNAVLNNKMDSLSWLPEALTVLMHKGLKDISHDSLSPEQSLWNRRLVNHLRNSFAKFSSETGWTPTIPYETTLLDMLNYWRSTN